MRVLTFKKARANYLFNKGLFIFERERERVRTRMQRGVGDGGSEAGSELTPASPMRVANS